MGVEWEAAGIVVHAALFGEGDILAGIFTEAHGIYRGLARGGASRTKANIWQVGNLVDARWMARLSDQLGSFSAELVHPAAALAMQDGLALSVLTAACAVAEGALPEREPSPAIFRGLLHLVVHCSQPEAVRDLVLWEAGLLMKLGYGLDLSHCALTGAHEGLCFVSPKSGRAVSEAGAGLWKEKLLPLPAFMTGTETLPSVEECAQGLRITGHFLARDVFGIRNKPLPAVRERLYDQIADRAG
jgi:DNA repair protein RecO (recombination protein O)